MGKNRRSFKRTADEKGYRKLFVIATEGSKTEPNYFTILKRLLSKTQIDIKVLKSNHNSDPSHVLKQMKAHLKKNSIKLSDEAWLVIDKDQWTDEQLNKLYEWKKEPANHGIALSNPKFEYWLLLHFEDGNNISSSKDCSERLKKHLPDYDKKINDNNLPLEMIQKAVARAQKRDNPPCKDWPRSPGNSTVYKLVKNLLSETSSSSPA